MTKQVFALDIGTRSVTGIILEKKDEQFTLIDYCTKEHDVRSMHDGQIHDVPEVADVINQVKDTLEKDYGPLHKVSIAAAGRSLKTIQASSTLEIHDQPITDVDVIKHLELDAVLNAQHTLLSDTENDHNTHYYCVGYSVLSYHIDGTDIGNLLDQRGQNASVNIIATFLPKIVIESLLAALTRAQLEMEALTLEPIAAINVLIPQSMRKLNVALVDVGAGTSDVALTNHGTVIAYGMVPVAGDEITEAISQHYLLDFPVAEQTKKNIVNNKLATVQDILGVETNVTYQDLAEVVIDQVDGLAQTIANEIIRLNGKPPQAVMLVGGGSLTPHLTDKLALTLKLPENRVAIRDIHAIQQLRQSDDLPKRPDLVTPIGIAIAANENPIHYVNVTVNNHIVRMFKLNQLTIKDALLNAGMEMTPFFGRPGMAHFIKVNGQALTLPGSYGEAPTIEINGQPATIDSPIKNGDTLSIQKGSDGETPSVTINELFDELPSLSFVYNHQPVTLKPIIHVNDEQVTTDYFVKDNDQVQVKQLKTIHDFLSQHDSVQLSDETAFMIFLNHKQIQLNAGTTNMILNGQKASSETPLKNGDELFIKHQHKPLLTDLLKQINETYWQTLNIQFNGQRVVLKQPRLKVMRDNTTLTEDSVLFPNDRLKLVHHPTTFIFQDVFRFVDFNIHDIQGQFSLLINRKKARFDDILKANDHLEIIWED